MLAAIDVYLTNDSCISQKQVGRAEHCLAAPATCPAYMLSRTCWARTCRTRTCQARTCRACTCWRKPHATLTPADESRNSRRRRWRRPCRSTGAAHQSRFRARPPTMPVRPVAGHRLEPPHWSLACSAGTRHTRHFSNIRRTARIRNSFITVSHRKQSGHMLPSQAYEDAGIPASQRVR